MAAVLAGGRTRRLRAVVGLQLPAIGLDVAVECRHLLGKPLARHDARLAGVTVEERAVDRHQRATRQAKFTHEQHKLTVHRFERAPIIAAETGNGPMAGRQAPQQPDQFEIALGLSLQPARGTDLIEIAVEI